MNEIAIGFVDFAVGALVGFLAGVVWVSFLSRGGTK